MRLIDADEAKKFYKENLILPEKSHEIIVRTMIDAVPTAYDIDKVVEELEERQKKYLAGFGVHNNDEMYGVACGLGDAIEIVKQGGVGKESD